MPAMPAASSIRTITLAFLLVDAGALWIACSAPSPRVAEQDPALMPLCPEGLHIGLTEDEVKRLRPDTFSGTAGWGRLLEVNIDCGLFNRVDYNFKPMISLLGPRRLVHFALRRQKSKDDAIESHRARFVSTAIGKWGPDFDRWAGTGYGLRDLAILRWRKRDVTILAVYVPSLDPYGRPTGLDRPPGRDYSFQIVVVDASASERDYLHPFARADEVSGASNLFTDVEKALASPPLPDEERLF
jgi:hypothetical protein